MARGTRRNEKRPEQKKFPNSVARTILAITQWWRDAKISSEKMTTPVFLEKTAFLTKYREAIEKFGGVRKTPRPEADAVLTLLQALARASQSLDFPKQQAIADYVGTPLGLLFYFTRLVADERQKQKHGEDLRCEIKVRAEALRAYAQALEELASEANPYAFIEPVEAELGYAVKIGALKKLSDAYASALGEKN